MDPDLERDQILPALVARARRFAESGQTPVAPRLAATVVLLRSAPGSAFEVYAQRRAASMAFAPNMYVFPGGTVDPQDGLDGLAWAGPDPARWAALLGRDERSACAVACAAVREVFEECGVLLAGPTPESVVAEVTDPEWEAARAALVAHELGFAELLSARGLVLRTDLLVPWARWLTPESEPRRYDTYFFLAQLPERQQPRDVGGEASHGRWLVPAQAPELTMMPPTASTFRQLGTHSTVDSAIASAPTHELSTPFMPTIEDLLRWS